MYEKRKPRVKETTRTVTDLWEIYLKSYNLSGKKAGWRQEASSEHLKGTFGSTTPKRATTASLLAYQEARLAEGAGPATTNRELSALSAAFFHAAKVTVEDGKTLLERVPVFPAKLKEPAPRKGFVTDKEYAVLAANAKPLWLRALIACAYSFGFRRGELLNMHVSQLDFFDRWIQLEPGTTKNGEGRKVKMTAEVFELMRARTHGKNPDDFVFTRENGKPVADPRDALYSLSAASGLGQWVKVKRENGEEYQSYRGLHLHDFRRSAVRQLLRRGVSQHVAMRISGHKTPSVFRRYDIVDERDLEQATQKIEAGRKVSRSRKTDTKTDTSSFSTAPSVSIPSVTS